MPSRACQLQRVLAGWRIRLVEQAQRLAFGAGQPSIEVLRVMEVVPWRQSVKGSQKLLRESGVVDLGADVATAGVSLVGKVGLVRNRSSVAENVPSTLVELLPRYRDSRDHLLARKDRGCRWQSPNTRACERAVDDIRHHHSDRLPDAK